MPAYEVIEMDTNVNMRFYDASRTVPDTAIKPITAGRLKGMSDINPMWRIKQLTDLFGPCGIGWWYEITDRRIIEDPKTNQSAAFVDILLYYIDPSTGTTSHGIPGTGGASFVAQESKGAYMSDECFKMALSDAISVSCKALGFAADIYYDKDRSKYTASEDDPPKQPKKQEPVQDVPRCQGCHAPILSKDPNITPEQLAETRRLLTQGKKFKNGLRLCDACYENWLKNYGPQSSQQNMEGVAEE